MSLDQMGVIEFENTSTEASKNSDKDSTLMESKNSNHGASLYPITPCLTEEKVKFTSLLKPKGDDDDNDNDPSTPMEDVFDPCASGSIQKNHLETSVSRKLDFGLNDDCGTENEVDNGLLMETVYEFVLDAIISKQAEDILAEILVPDSSRDVLKTPPSVAQVTGLDEVCPGAPLKPKQVRNKRTVDMRLCRKLDFDSWV